jgi:hypothetical protein
MFDKVEDSVHWEVEIGAEIVEGYWWRWRILSVEFGGR